MERIRIVAIAAALFLPIAGVGCGPPTDSHAKPAEEGLETVYLGNEGFLVTAGEHSVLIDALQGPGLDGYETMPAAKRAEMEQAQPPFDRVGLVLATHHHPDHFDVASVTRYLNANPRAVFVSTPEAVRRVSQGTGLGERAIAMSPKVGEPDTRKVGGWTIEAYRLHHGQGREIDNFGYRIRRGDRSLLHVGDTMVTAEEMAAEKIHEQGVDLYFVPYWQLLNDDRAARLAAVNPRHVVAMHVPSAAAPSSWLDPYPDRDALIRAIRGENGDVVVFKRIGQERTLSAADR